MKSDVAISIRQLTKDFQIYEKPVDLALEVLTRRKRHRDFRALDNVSFEVERGQVLGIIGANGAGKSTLLKIITGVLDASAGSVDVSGKVTAILELGLGFNPEYSGRDNIYLSGLLYGMSRKEIDQKLESIVEFSGLRAFMDQPVKTYSSGMHARLAFSIATAVDPEVLIIDEALAAGDAMFTQKSMRRIRQLCGGGRTVLLVSHGTSILAQLCKNVLWLEAGKVKMLGPALHVVQAYDLAAHQGADEKSWIEVVDDIAPTEPVASVKTVEKQVIALPPITAFDRQKTADQADGSLAEAGRNVFRRGPIFIDAVTMLGAANTPTTLLTTLRPFALRIDYHCDGAIPDETLGIALAVNRLGDLAPVTQWYTQFIRPDETAEAYQDAAFRVKASRRGRIELAFPYAPFRQDEYILSIGLLPNAPGSWEFYEYRHFFYPFKVTDGTLSVGAPVYFEPTAVRFIDLSSEPLT